MPQGINDYERVSIYGLDSEVQEQLLWQQRECVLNWSTQDGWPVGVIMSFIWRDGRFWMTAGAQRHRIAAIRRDPRVSVVVTSTGTKMGRGKTVTAKGRCVIHEDRETKAWFYPEFAKHLSADDERAAAFAERLDSPLRVVLEMAPEQWITYDGTKMWKDERGLLEEDEKTPPKSSDTVRLDRERRLRGID